MSAKATNPATSTTKKTNTKGTAVKKQEESTHPLAHLIPSKEVWLDSYVGRTIAGVEDLTIFKAAHRRLENVLLFGPTGSAKTTVTYTYAASVGLPLVNIACNGAIDNKSLFGGWSPTPDGSWKFVPGDLPLAVQHGGIILINEANFAPPKILAAIYGLLDRRRTLKVEDAAGSDYPTTIQAHKDCLIVADFNPDYIGTRPLSEAFLNRFAHKLPWGYSREVEDQLIGVTALQNIADSIRDRHNAGDISGSVPTNLMLEFLDNAYDEDLGVDYAIANFVSAFPVDEQQVIHEVFNIHSAELLVELGVGDE